MNRHLLKYVNAQNGEYRVNTDFEAEFFAYNEQQSVYSNGTPDLGFHGVWLTAEEHVDAQMLLEPLEEKFDLPACFIEQCDFKGRQREVIGKEHQGLSRFSISVDNPAKLSRIRSLRPLYVKPDDLVADHTGTVMHRLTRATVESQIGFCPGNKERLSQIDLPESVEVDVTSVNDIQCLWLKAQGIEPVDVMGFSISDMHQRGNRPVQIEQGVNLDGSLLFAEVCPRENRQTQVGSSGFLVARIGVP